MNRQEIEKEIEQHLENKIYQSGGELFGLSECASQISEYILAKQIEILEQLKVNSYAIIDEDNQWNSDIVVSKNDINETISNLKKELE